MKATDNMKMMIMIAPHFYVLTIYPSSRLQFMNSNIMCVRVGVFAFHLCKRCGCATSSEFNCSVIYQIYFQTRILCENWHVTSTVCHFQSERLVYISIVRLKPLQVYLCTRKHVLLRLLIVVPKHLLVNQLAAVV